MTVGSLSTGPDPCHTHAGHTDDQCLAAFLSDLPSVTLPVTFSGDHTRPDWSLFAVPGSPFPSVAAFQASPWTQHPRSLPRCFCSSRKSEGRRCGQDGGGSWLSPFTRPDLVLLICNGQVPHPRVGAPASSPGPLALKEAVSPRWTTSQWGLFIRVSQAMLSFRSLHLNHL